MSYRNLDRVEVRKCFARTIRILRQKAGKAQETLAYESGVDRGYTGGLERGLHSPTLETIFKFLTVLDVSFTDFAIEMDRQIRRKNSK